jgi:hypothetical protein
MIMGILTPAIKATRSPSLNVFQPFAQKSADVTRSRILIHA